MECWETQDVNLLEGRTCSPLSTSAFLMGESLRLISKTFPRLFYVMDGIDTPESESGTFHLFSTNDLNLLGFKAHPCPGEELH